MFTPKYRITEHFLGLVEQIASLSEKIEAKNIRLPLMTQLQKEALDRNVHASTSIEGNILSLDQVSALSQNRDVDADLKQKQEVLNYFEALKWIINNPKRKVNEKSLLRLHAVIVKNLLPAEKSGNFRNKQNFVINDKKIVIYTPPPPRKCPKLIVELLEWVNKVDEIHSIIRSAIFHHQFVNIHPFSDGNGRVARAAAQWILYQRNSDPHHILSLDDFYANDRKRYYDKIQQTRDLDYDFTHWIEYVSEGILHTIKSVYNRINKLSYSANAKIVLTPKQEEILNALSVSGSLGSRELCKIFNINRARVNQLISPLIKAKIIQKVGMARATKYLLKKK